MSRYWRSLLEDEAPWKEMCDRHRFQAVISPISNHSTTSHTRVVQNAISEMRNLHVGSTRSVDARLHSARDQQNASVGKNEEEDVFSYRNLFKRNYLTGESCRIGPADDVRE